MAPMLLIHPMPQANSETPKQVINSYLAYLVDGNVTELHRLLGGEMKRNNRQLLASPDSCSEFLKSRYAEVRTTVEESTERGNKILVRVRFDYPSGESTSTEFVITGRNSQ